MGVSPQEIMKRNGFQKKMDEYIKKLEIYIDAQLLSRYDSFLEKGYVKISEHKLNAHLFRQKKNFPKVIRLGVLSGLSPLYPDWKIVEEMQSSNCECFFAFYPQAREQVVEEVASVEETVAPVENRSELLDLEDSDGEW